MREYTASKGAKWPLGKGEEAGDGTYKEEGVPDRTSHKLHGVPVALAKGKNNREANRGA